jgi:hypothetical protein
VAEYSSREFMNPIGEADWETKLVKHFPKEPQETLPRVEQIKTEFTQEDN